MTWPLLQEIVSSDAGNMYTTPKHFTNDKDAQIAPAPKSQLFEAATGNINVVAKRWDVNYTFRPVVLSTWEIRNPLAPAKTSDKVVFQSCMIQSALPGICIRDRIPRRNFRLEICIFHDVCLAVSPGLFLSGPALLRASKCGESLNH
jgi:hypothetical protein